MTTTHTNVLILGAGPAGYTAAIYAARAGLDPLMVTGMQPGGQLMVTTDVENYPGFAEMIQGPWLMDQMRLQAEHVGVKMVTDHIQKVDFSKRPFTCVGDMGDLYTADTVIVATGAKAKWLEIPSEEKFMGFGVSACATCDGFFFRGKRVAVIGGGNTAVEEALYMTSHASHVYLIHRRDSLRSEKMLQDRLFQNPKVEVLWNQKIDEILGTEKPKSVTGLRLENTETGIKTTLDVEGVFVAIGHAPQTSLFEGILDMDTHRYLTVLPGTTRTNIQGIFAAGDVQDSIYRQAVTAAGQGCMAALDAQKFLSIVVPVGIERG